MSVGQTLKDATWPSVSMTGVTELRVHGVGGTPPGDMLDGPEPFQVSGDRTAGIWRLGATPGTATHRVEAYAWGGLTSRPLASALWLLILPLSLINVAGWMCPARNALGSGLFRGVIRLAGLAVTLLYVSFAAVVGMDFAAYQCAGAADRGLSCAATSWWLVGNGGVMHDAALRVLAGAVLPLALVTLLGVLARRSRIAYEEYEGADSHSRDGNVDNPAKRGLDYPSFWRGEAYADRLAELHLAAGILVVAYIVVRSAEDLTDSTAAGPIAVVIGIALVATLVLASTTRLRRRIPERLALGFAVVAMAVATVATIAAPPARPNPPTALIAVTEIFNPLVGSMPLLSLVVFCTALVVGWTSDRGREQEPLSVPSRLIRLVRVAAKRVRHAATPSSLVVIAFMLTLTFLSGMALTVAFSVGDAKAYQRNQTRLPAVEYAQAFEVLARAVPLFIAVFALAAVFAWLVAGHGEREETRREAAWASATRPPGWRDAESIERWISGVRDAHRVPRKSLAAIEWGAWTLSAVAITASLVWMANWWFAAREQGTPHLDVELGWFGKIPLAPCLLLLTSIVAGGLYAIRRTLVSPTTRRVMAVAWDVATFWPRSFQPLGPPSYAERAVPELAARIARLQGDKPCPGSVLLLGHSQGAVLVAAVVASLPLDQRQRLDVITYGNPLCRLYGRHFPAYLPTQVIEDIVDSLGRAADGSPRWRNAFKDTDFIGHRMFSEQSPDPYHKVDVYLPDPPHPFMPSGDPPPPVRRHSEPGYRRQVAFQELRETAKARLSAHLSPNEPAPDDSMADSGGPTHVRRTLWSDP